MTSISPDRSDVFDALRAFLLAVLPEGVDVVAGMPNRVAEPSSPNFAVMSALRLQRLRTNIDSPDDVLFTGSIAADAASFTGAIAPTQPQSPDEMPSGTMDVSAIASGVIRVGAEIAGVGVDAAIITEQLTGTAGGVGTYRVSKPQEVVPGSAITSSCGVMTVSAVDRGEILPDAFLFGTGLTLGSRVRALGTGSGGVGTYIVSPSQTISSRSIAASGKLLETGSKFTVQIDFHSYDLNYSADMAATVQSAFRDSFATAFFEEIAPEIAPLYADDPRLVPFVNENQQVESRWILDAEMQINQTIRVPAQFADAVSVEIISVDAEYPP